MNLEATKKTESKDYTTAWMLVSISGLFFFIFSAMIGAEFKIDFLTNNSFAGWMIMVFPLLVFQFNLFAGLSDLKIDLSDLKNFSFLVLNFLLLVVDTFFFASADLVFKIIPGFNAADSLMSGDYLNFAWPYALGIYSFIASLGLMYRFAHKARLLVVTII